MGASLAKAQTAAPKKSTSSKSGATRRTKSSKKAPAPERISEIQQALAKDGSFSGTPNGKWDESTVEAMKKFQEAHGLNPTGKLDAKTLMQLGLGSQTAGVAPPLPPMSSTTAIIAPAQTVRRQQ
jgi:peptidoglycan hydrolase-like protein with peptidoglycan-binding domain